MSLIEQIPQTILRQGEIVAEGATRLGKIAADRARNNGELVGNLISQVGALPRDLILAKQAETKQKFENLKIQAETDTINDTKTAKAALDKGWTTNADGVVTFDRAAITKALPGHLVPKVTELLDAADESTAKLAEQQQKMTILRQNQLGALAAGVHEAGNTLEALQGAADYAIRNKSLTAEQVQPFLDKAAADPSTIPTITATLMGQSHEYKDYLVNAANKNALNEQRLSSAQAREQASNDAALKNQAERDTRALANAATQLANAPTKAEYERRYRGLPPELQAQFDEPAAWTKDTAQRARFVAMTPEKQQEALNRLADNDRDQKRLAEQREHDIAMENRPTGQGGTRAAGGVTQAQKNVAERWKLAELDKLEKWFADPAQTVLVPDPKNPSGPGIESKEGKLQKLNEGKAKIQASYLEQIGAAAPKGSAPAAPSAPAAATTPAPAAIAAQLKDDTKYPRGFKYQGPGGVIYLKNKDGSVTVAAK